jgi:hypothetical protein
MGVLAVFSAGFGQIPDHPHFKAGDKQLQYAPRLQGQD